MKVFADDITVYKLKVVASVSDCQILQDDSSCLYDWTVAWQVHLNPAKCEALNLSHKLSPPQFTYTVNGGTISWKPLVKDLGIYISSKLTQSDQCKLTASRSKAIRISNILHRTMFGCSTCTLAIDAKDVAYRSIVRLCMEYACVVWNPHTARDCALLDAVH